MPVPVQHGPWTDLGFRFGAFAYLPIASASGRGAVTAASTGVECWCSTPCGTARIHAFAGRMAGRAERAIGARRTYFTPWLHDLGHAVDRGGLAQGVALAHDGLVLEIPPRREAGA